ncbi:MAG TPA: PLP-dependent transferase, partial [Hyphomicrobiaceae bacterium]|nr:PLP-dependent transferase [Hyphomicrobiaceae bacterium]
MTRNTLAPETVAAQAGDAGDEATGAIVPPVHLATTFVRDPDNQYRKGFSYGRPDNATVRQVERVLAELEGGAGALVVASGMTAATMAFLALERPAHVVAPKVMYWGLRDWISRDAPSFGIEPSFVDGADPAAIAAAIRPGATKLVWLETPANPLWTITDIAAAAKLAHA